MHMLNVYKIVGKMLFDDNQDTNSKKELCLIFIQKLWSFFAKHQNYLQSLRCVYQKCQLWWNVAQNRKYTVYLLSLGIKLKEKY